MFKVCKLYKYYLIQLNSIILFFAWVVRDNKKELFFPLILTFFIVYSYIFFSNIKILGRKKYIIYKTIMDNIIILSCIFILFIFYKNTVNLFIINLTYIIIYYFYSKFIYILK